MKETAAGMTQSMPLYLMVVGVVLIIALAFLIKKMGKKESQQVSSASQDEETPTTATASPSAEPEEVVKEAASPQASTEEPQTQTSVASEAPEATLTLPVEAKPFVESPDIDRQSFDRFRGKRVLVVEDNPVNRKLILTLMGGTGIELDSAEDGLEALEKMREPGARFDLVLMDVNMPKMDGLECTRQIRADASLKETPVLALTASTTPEEVQAILESGMNGYLDKPLNLGKLYTAFVRFMEEYRVPDASPAREEAQNPQGWTDSQVLDTKTGLEHTNDDAGLYRMLLQDFLGQYGESHRQFASLVQAKDYEGLRALVIDLEGLAGTLGALELYRVLLDANRALEQGTTMLLPDYAEEYEAALGRLKAQIERYLA